MDVITPNRMDSIPQSAPLTLIDLEEEDSQYWIGERRVTEWVHTFDPT